MNEWNTQMVTVRNSKISRIRPHDVILFRSSFISVILDMWLFIFILNTHINQLVCTYSSAHQNSRTTSENTEKWHSSKANISMSDQNISSNTATYETSISTEGYGRKASTSEHFSTLVSTVTWTVSKWMQNKLDGWNLVSFLRF